LGNEAKRAVLPGKCMSDITRLIVKHDQGIGLRFMRLVGPSLAAKVYRGIARIVGRSRRLLVLCLKTLRPRPRLQQRAVHRETLVRGQALGSRLPHDMHQKLLGHVGFQQAIAVLGEHRRVLHLVVQVQSDKPTEQHAVVDLFHQQPLAANRIQHLQQLRSQQLLGRNRQTPRAGVHRIKPARQLLEHFIHHGPEGAPTDSNANGLRAAQFHSTADTRPSVHNDRSSDLQSELPCPTALLSPRRTGS